MFAPSSQIVLHFIGYKPHSFTRNLKSKLHILCDFDRACSLICGNKMPTAIWHCISSSITCILYTALIPGYLGKVKCAVLANKLPPPNAAAR